MLALLALIAPIAPIALLALKTTPFGTVAACTLFPTSVYFTASDFILFTPIETFMKKPAVLFLLVLSTGVLAQGSKSHATIPPDFATLSYEEANKAVESEDTLINAEKIKTIGPEYIDNLVAQLRSGKLSNDNKTLAIYFLGVLRPTDTNAIKFLIENIDFKATIFDPILKTRTNVKRWGEYPSEDALIRLGKPVVNPILDALPKENSELRRSLLCLVLKGVWRNWDASTK